MEVFRGKARQGNKSFIIKGRGSSVVEQPIRNRQAASSTLALGSIFFTDFTEISYSADSDFALNLR